MYIKLLREIFFFCSYQVLSLQDGSTNELQLKSLEENSSIAFLDKYSRFLVYFEKVFLVLVIIDAAVTASKFAGMGDAQKIALQVWQVKGNRGTN